MGNWKLASVLCTFYLLLFFTFGHVHEALGNTQILGRQIARYRYILPIWVMVFAMGTWLLVKRLRSYHSILRGIMVFSIAAVTVPLLQLAAYHLGDGAMLSYSSSPQRAVQAGSLQLVIPEELPDVYYIILDMYTRDDTLLSRFDLDNSEFLEELQGLGFYIASCSRSNYPRTRFSLTSSLNMDYLEPLGITSEATNKRTEQLIKHGLVRSVFEQLGYKIIAYETKFYWTEWDDADFYLTLNSSAPQRMLRDIQHLVLNDFELMFMRTTLLRAYVDLSDSILTKLGVMEQNRTIGRAFEELPRRSHYYRTQFVLDSLPEQASLDVPKFVFAHIVSPHAPFVFGPNGEFTPEEPADEIEGYRDQVIYLDKELIDLLSEILAVSEPAPIIVLQGDHGATGTRGTVDETKILNAYYLPGEGRAALYPGISPVNSFRLILDTYFGANLGILDDISHYTSDEGKFVFQQIPDDRPGCARGSP
jgi:hypothetical protein